MTLYEIDSALLALIDQSTGELMDYESFVALQMKRADKLEGVALWYKNEVAQATSIKAEEDALRERRKAHERLSERLKATLSDALMGEKFETPRCSVSFRKTSAVKVGDPAALIAWAESNGHEALVRHKEPELSKADISKLIKSGVSVPSAEIVDGLSLAVK